MILTLILSVIVVVVLAAPPPNNIINFPKDNVQLLRFENNDFGKGSYSFVFEQSDGTKHEQRGELKNEGLKGEHIVMSGSYSWVGPDGVSYTVNYVADDNGFDPRIEQGPGRALSTVLHNCLNVAFDL